MREANIESFSSLVDNLDDLGLEMADLPLVLQYNKRDLKNILTVEELNSDLNPHGRYACHEASAINGDGVFETLKEITKLTLRKLRKRMASSQPGGAAPAAEPVRPAMPSQRPESISAASLARAAEEGVVSESAPQPAPATPTTVAPPMPASEPRAADSDVFSTPDPPPDEPPSEGPLDGPLDVPDHEPVDEPAVEPVDLPSMEVTAPEVEAASSREPAFESPDEIEVDLDDDAEADDWQDKETEVSELHTGGAEVEIDPTETIDFDQQANEVSPEAPPPMKRVHVSNQLDILAELEGLRTGTLSGSSPRSQSSRSAEIDIDSLISGAVGGAKEVRRRVKKGLDHSIFSRMQGVEMVVAIKDSQGSTIHTLEPIVTEVEGAGELTKLTVRFGLDLKNDG
jgi:hypothetical protein